MITIYSMQPLVFTAQKKIFFLFISSEVSKEELQFILPLQ